MINTGLNKKDLNAVSDKPQNLWDRLKKYQQPFADIHSLVFESWYVKAYNIMEPFALLGTHNCSCEYGKLWTQQGQIHEIITHNDSIF